MLERVPLLEKDLDAYVEFAGPEAIDRIRRLAEPLRGARVLHVNATAYGGGVAELLATHVPLLQSLGIQAEWQVIHGSDELRLQDGPGAGDQRRVRSLPAGLRRPPAAILDRSAVLGSCAARRGRDVGRGGPVLRVADA